MGPRFLQFLVLMATFSFSLQAQYMKELPNTAAEEYRKDSNFGPEIAVLNPLFPRASKVEISLGGEWQPVSSLHNYFAAHLSGVFHINRRHAIEPVWFQYHFGDWTNFVQKEIRDKTPRDTRFIGVEIPKWTYMANYYFSPYYSKIHITEETVSHFDTYLGLGLAVLGTEEKMLSGAAGDTHTRVGGVVSLGVRFLFQPRWALRLEFKDIIYRGENIGASSTQHNLQMALAFSLFFGSFPSFTSL